MDVPPAVPAELKVTKHHSVDETCTVLQKIGLGQCIPILRKYNVDGEGLLEATQADFIALLEKGDIPEFIGRLKWRKLEHHLDFM